MATLANLPGTLSIVVYQGATLSVSMTWKTGSTPSPVNLTGFTGLMKIKDGQDTVATLSTENGGIVLGGSSGTITLYISAEDTTSFTPTNAEYDLLLTSAGGIVTALVSGLVEIRAGVSAN